MAINYDDFSKVEIRAGKILSAEKVPDTDKLLKLSVDMGEKKGETQPDGTSIEKSAPRQIVSGIALYFPDPSVLVGKTCMFVANLEPRTIRGLESNGMLFALSTPEQKLEDGTVIPGNFSLLEPNEKIPPGTRAY